MNIFRELILDRFIINRIQSLFRISWFIKRGIVKKLTANDLKKIKTKVQKNSRLEIGAKRAKITIHMGTCGIASGAKDIQNEMLKIFKEKDISDIVLTVSGCAGLCSYEPMVTIEIAGKPPVKYIDLTKTKMLKIFNEHVINGNVVQDYALAIGSEQTH